MADDHNHTVSDFHRLQVMAAESRLRAIRSQIAAGLTFCRVAETELASGHTDEAHKILEKLREATDVVRRHLGEPNRVPPAEIEKVLSELAHLESRILSVEKREQEQA